MEEHVAQLQSCMYQYSRAIYRSVKDLIDPYVDSKVRLEYRRSLLEACELAAVPLVLTAGRLPPRARWHRCP